VDQAIRNKLRGVVTQCRKLLEESVAHELLGKFGIYASKKDDVQVDEENRLTLSAEERTARKNILDHLAHIQARGFKAKEAFDQLVREIAFTHMNRLCAYKMMEARQVYVGDQKFREAISRGINSNGVKFYMADHPDEERLFNTGKQHLAYTHFLDWLGGLLSEEIGVLFNQHDSANSLYPPQHLLNQVLDLINDKSLADIWVQDETIGWVYQYFTPKELRDQARKESAAPRNSYELAFRNQFFTPRYVVEFLTDNTLGRIWYEMRRGKTKLMDQCRYMVRRPNEVFLAERQTPPASAQNHAALSQEELLKQPVHIPHRPKKDPRELRILDPACGSGHFLLYCFDLLLTIYEEAYSDPDLGPKLKEVYPTIDALRRDAPRLILAHNLHGIDIDLRCTQIAALALWLRCQRAYKEMREMGLKQDRHKITKSNIVCAEPMPGEKALLDEFIKTLNQDRLEDLIRRVMQVPEGSQVRTTESMLESLHDLVRLVWDKMQLAGEAGSLLKIEEDLQEAIRKGQEEWEEKQSLFRFTEFSLTEKSKETYVRFIPGEGVTFWERAEALVLEALRNYARHASNGGWLQRQLFAEDAESGFAFIDICQKRFDVVLMNPPFGDVSKACDGLLEDVMASGGRDMGCAFVSESASRLSPRGLIAALLTATPLFQPTFSDWRQRLLLGRERTTSVLAHLGGNVLDEATVIVCAFVSSSRNDALAPFFRLDRCDDKEHGLLDRVEKLREGIDEVGVFLAVPDEFRRLKGSPVSYWMSARFRHRLASLPPLEGEGGTSKQGTATADEFRFARAWWEVATDSRWINYSKSSEYSPFWDDMTWLLNFGDNGNELRETGRARIQGTSYFGKPGVTYPSKSVLGFNPRAHPAGAGFGHSGSVVFPNAVSSACMLGYLASRPAEYALSLLTGSLQGEAGFRPVHYEVGVVGSLPFPQMSPVDQEAVASHSMKATQLVRSLFVCDETSRDFVSPLIQGSQSAETLDVYAKALSLHEIEVVQKVRNCQSQIDDIITRTLQLTLSDVQEMNREFASRLAPTTGRWRPYFGVEPDPYSPTEGATRLVSYCLGCLLGRWDIRFATGMSKADSLTDPFGPCASRPPGMLLEDGQKKYPIRIDSDGIHPDDPDHSDDIIRGVREVLELIWKDRAEAIEKEACEILGVKELREYFRKPGNGGFWLDHVARYSKSRRKAPIYWLLQSSKKNYALWLYYQRLDKETLLKALLPKGPVQTKINVEQSRLVDLRKKRTAAEGVSKTAKKLDKEIDKQEDLLNELMDFAEKLERAAKLEFGDKDKLNSNIQYAPDLNDGVVLNIAPLHELVPWKEAGKYWQELLDGKYEWSSMGKLLREKGLVK